MGSSPPLTAEDAGFFELMLGAHNVRLDASQEPQRVEVTATDYYIYPSWDTYTLRNDIAIIKMPAPITNDECGSVYSIINDNHICIDTSNGHGSCNGDSGGPLSQVQSDGRFTQVGIVSFGSSA